jgi:hypothetical protein
LPLVWLLAFAQSDDPVPLLVSVLAALNGRRGGIVAQLRSKGVGIMRASAVGALALNSFSERRGRALNIAVLTKCQLDGDWPSEKIGGDADLGRAGGSLRGIPSMILNRALGRH